MSTILPNEDPMIQQAIQAERQQQEVMAGLISLKRQMFVAIFTQLAMKHNASGEELGLESGRALASQASDTAEEVVGQYASFMFEKMGILKLDKPAIVE